MTQESQSKIFSPYLPSFLKWVESYLKNRKQFVMVSANMSKTHNIPKYIRVPQGSRLSLLLFYVCLMADMDLWTRDSMITNFADDTQSIVIKDGKDEAVEITLAESLLMRFLLEQCKKEVSVQFCTESCRRIGLKDWL